MEIWTLMNGKGGVGKTTIATNLAHALSVMGFTVCLVDTDPQGSVRDWHETGGWDLFPVVAMDRQNALKHLKETLRDFDYVIIDTPGRIESILGTAVALSDKVLIPVQPSPYDIWATNEVVRMVKDRQEIANGNPLGAFIISRAIKNTLLGKDVTSALLEYELPVLKACTTQRVGYAHAASIGSTVFKTNQRDAKDEIMEIAREIIALKLPTKEIFDVFA